MNNPAAGGRGIETDLLVERWSTAQGSKTSTQGAGNSTPEKSGSLYELSRGRMSWSQV
jgi:hypothetical protein